MPLIRTIFASTLILVLSECSISTQPADNFTQKVQKTTVSKNIANNDRAMDAAHIRPDLLLTLHDAESVMGESLHMTDSSTVYETDGLTYQCAYKALAKDPKTSKTGAIYFLFRRYNDTAAAIKRYRFIKKANEGHGIETLNDLCDEAYFHSDGENFYFVMARQGNIVFNIKVNQLTSTTSREAFNSVARQIGQELQ